MKVVVDRGRCSGNGICESISPEHFEIGDDGALMLLQEEFTKADRPLAEEAVSSCPAQALSIQHD